jgi:hypothetical protein
MSKHNGEKKDTVWVGPDLGDGLRPALRVDTAGNVHAGTLGPARPDANCVLNLKQVKGPFYEVVDEGRAVPLAGGPPKVSSEAYRTGWARIFGNKHTVGQA